MHIELSNLPLDAKRRIINLRDWDFTKRILSADKSHDRLAQGDEPKLERAKGLITREAEKLIWEQAFNEITGEPNTSGIDIEATEDRVTLHTPHLSTHFPEMRIKVQREDLAPGINALVTPDSPSSQ